METNQIMGQTHTFKVPSGATYTIREQNGADDDVISNVADASNLMNFSKFIAGLVIETDAVPTKKLTPDMAHRIPVLDRYCIMLNSRIFSMGPEVEFVHDWGEQNGGEIQYRVDLAQYLLDYNEYNNEEATSKPDAIPFYPEGQITTGLGFTTSSGKELLFDCLTAEGEAFIMNSPMNKQTKNQGLIARNLRYKMGEEIIPVENFSVFTVRDMQEIRSTVKAMDPTWDANCEIVNPLNEQPLTLNLMGIKSFFFPEEM